MFNLPQFSEKALQELKDIYRRDFDVEMTDDEAMTAGQFIFMLTCLQKAPKQTTVAKKEPEALPPIELERHEDGTYWLTVPLQPAKKPVESREAQTPASSLQNED